LFAGSDTPDDEHYNEYKRLRHQEDFDGIRTPLIEVASAGHVNIVSCLITHKADVVILDLHCIT